MKLFIPAILIIAALSTPCRPAEVDLYTQNTKSVSFCIYASSGTGTMTELPAGGPNGSKCMSYVYSVPNDYYGTFGIKGPLAKPADSCSGAALDLSGHATLSFEAMGDIHDFQVLCPFLTGAVSLSPPMPATWRSYLVHLSSFTVNGSNNLANVNNIQFAMDAPTQGGTAHFYVCNVILDPASSVRPSSDGSEERPARELRFQKTGMATVCVYGMNGTLVSSYHVPVAAHSPVADIVRREFPAGAHVVTIFGAGVSVVQKILR